MNDKALNGDLKTAAGKLQSGVGKALGDDDLRAEGDARQFGGKVEKGIGAVEDTVNRTADNVKATIARASDNAKDAYRQTSGQVEDLLDEIEQFAKEKPVAALGLAALGGLLVGLLYASRRPKVVYLRPRP